MSSTIEQASCIFDEMMTPNGKLVRSKLIPVIAFALFCWVSASGDEHTINHFLEVDSKSVAFPEVASLTDTSRSLSTRFGDWRFSIPT